MAAAAGAVIFPTAARPAPAKARHKGATILRAAAAVGPRSERALEEIYKVRVERGVSKERLEVLGVERWSTWKTGRCVLPWDWHVDQQVYVVKGEVRVVPEGGAAFAGRRYMRFVAGDLVRYPKWFEADLFFDGPYEERYRFRAYGDDD
uniref:Ribonuclease HII n=1 Tax=Anthurium amnicola TaxID=1678845 RepID=A0A1D1XCX7_9ARAE